MSDMDRKDFETQLRDINLSFLRTKRDSAENRRLPSFLQAYYRLVRKLERLPTQDEFVVAYFHVNDMERTEGVEARARRAYASIVREHHLGFVLRDHFEVEEHDEDVDEKGGVDYVIHYKGKKFKVHAFVDTPRSRMFRKKKKARHDENNDDGIHVDCKISPDDSKDIGDFWVYDERQMIALEEEFEKHI